MKIWHFPSYLAHDQVLQKIIQETWADYTDTNSEHRNNPNLFWEARRAVSRGKIIPYASAYKKKGHQGILWGKQSLAWGPVASCTTQIQRETWWATKSRFDSWAEAQEKMHQPILDLQYHKVGNKAGKLLTHLCKGQQVPTHIAALKDHQGKLTTILCVPLWPWLH